MIRRKDDSEAMSASLVVAAAQLIAVKPVVQAMKTDGPRYARAWQDFARLMGSGKPENVPPTPQLRAALRGVFIAMPAEKCDALLQTGYDAYDGLLREELAAATVTKALALPTAAPGIAVWQGDMSRLDADAVVNPCNNALLGCFLPEHKCLDNILHGAAGPRLRVACLHLLRDLGLEEDINGQCRVTPGFCLPARHVFHTVGPCLVDLRTHRGEPRAPTPTDRAELRSCYTKCLRTAAEMGLRSLAFCCISTGIFGYPQREAAQIAVSEVLQFQAEQAARGLPTPLVIFNVFKDDDLAIYDETVAAMTNGTSTDAA